jgi:hypothetical protein
VKEEKLMARKNSVHVLISFVTIFAVSGAMAANSASKAKPAIANYARPISFEPNRGQTDRQVDFLAHGASYNLFLSHAEAVMVLKHGTTVRMSPMVFAALSCDQNRSTGNRAKATTL